jgi:hypothetical protein
MYFTIDRGRHFLVAAGVLLSVSCATSARSQADVSGTWDAEFSGIVQGTGTSQTDEFIIEVRQNDSNVTGTLRLQGLDLPFELNGEVQGTTFTYTIEGSLGPSCEVTVEAETTIDVATGRLSGTQTQSTCEGIAVGQITAVRR